MDFYTRKKQEAHHQVRLCETPRLAALRRLFCKRCRYSLLEKFEDALDTALDLMQTKPSDAANFHKCLPETAGHVMSDVALEYGDT